MDISRQLEMVPEAPGVYIFRDAAGEVIYVGKAASLKHRVRSYFQESAASVKAGAVGEKTAGIEWIVTDNEVEALILECHLIKGYRPRLNVRLRDDKQYPYLKVTLGEQFPRLLIARRLGDDGAKYYGPYTSSQAVGETLKLIHRLFPLRRCKRLPPDGARACLNYHIKRCVAPCQGTVTAQAYGALVREACLLLEGRQELVLRELRARMDEAAAGLDFELAARIRDQIEAVEKLTQEQKAVLPDRRDRDVLGVAARGDRACVQLFVVREGKLVGREKFGLSGAAGLTAGDLVSAFLKQYYSRAAFVPAELLIQEPVDEARVIEAWLRHRRGGNVAIRVPARGEKRRLVEMAVRNAALVLEEELAEESRSREKAAEGLALLAAELGLPRSPKRIECFDVSNIHGTEAVASLVVFEDGFPLRDGYKRFRIKTVRGADDCAMLQEAIYRRYRQAPGVGLADLVVVDGGKGQLHAALEVLRDLDLREIPVIALAKEFEHVFIPGRGEPRVLPPGSACLHLLQRVRDEAHRFAVAYHRKLRAKKMVRSVLDEVPGIGVKRKRALLRRFGSVEGIAAASVEELAAIPGMNARAARTLQAHLSIRIRR